MVSEFTRACKPGHGKSLCYLVHLREIFRDEWLDLQTGVAVDYSRLTRAHVYLNSMLSG